MLAVFCFFGGRALIFLIFARWFLFFWRVRSDFFGFCLRAVVLLAGGCVWCLRVGFLQGCAGSSRKANAHTPPSFACRRLLFLGFLFGFCLLAVVFLAVST